MSSAHPLFKRFITIFLGLHVVIFLIYVFLLPEKLEEFIDNVSYINSAIRSWAVLKDASAEEALKAATLVNANMTGGAVQCDTLEVLAFLDCARAVVMTRQEGDILIDTVRLFTTLMEFHNITYVVTSGSLLGILRHGSYVPYDDDFDALVLSRERDKIRNIMKNELWPSINHSFFQSTEERKKLANTLHFHLYPHMKYYENHAHPKIYLNYKNCIHPRKYAYCWPFVDLFYFEDNGTHIYSREYRNEVYHYSSVYPLQRGWYSDVATWIPRDTSKFISPNSLTSCCTNSWLHKVEKPVTCFKCITCSCLRDWIHLQTPREAT